MHSRRAERNVLDILIDNKIKKAVFHWYSGPLSLIDKMIDDGHYFSINPAMIKSKNGQKIIERIRPDRIITETDGPYVKIQGNPAQPGDVNLVISYLKEVWNIPIEEVKLKIRKNLDGIIQHIKGR